MKKELLSPAGDMKSLKAAIHAGCDAVYIAGKKFGARKFSKNFDKEEIIEAINYAHLYGVKIYVAVNTLIYEREMEEALEYIEFLYLNHVDAVIVQDIGLILEIRKLYKDLEIHASTQLHNYTKENFDLLEELGVKRVVLARENDLKTINNIQTNLEKEVFIHGAICISYSGQCLFSSFVLNRSGNRGECAGMCRLPYKLKSKGKYVPTDGDYLLSPKELCTISKFQKLMESDIKCFKIEGRMKSPEYVYYVTKIYRTLMDKYYNGEKLEISEEEFNNLKVLYNRKFTEGYLFNDKNEKLMNIESPNHLGIYLGKVIKVNQKKIAIKLERNLNQEDGIRFLANNKGMIVNFLYNKKDMLIKEGKKGEVVYVDNKIGLSACCDVVKTTDKQLSKKIENYPLKKIPITMKFTGLVGKRITLEVSDGINNIKLEGAIVDKAINKCTTEKDIISKLSKLGSTPYIIEKIDIKIDDNAFIPLQFINTLRQSIVDELCKERVKRENVNICKKHVQKNVKQKEKNVKICVLVRNEEQLLTVANYDIERIYITDYSLYKKYENTYNNLYYRENRVTSSLPAKRKMITEFSKLKENSNTTDYYMNVANTSYLEYLETKNIKNVTLSVEMKKEDIKEVVRKNTTSIELEVVVYGKIELMLMKYSLNEMFNLSKNEKHVLVDRNNKEYLVIEEDNNTHIYHYETTIYNEQEIAEIINCGIDFIRLEFLDENKKQVANILEKYEQFIQKK